jgi:hypothetical protein
MWDRRVDLLAHPHEGLHRGRPTLVPSRRPVCNLAPKVRTWLAFERFGVNETTKVRSKDRPTTRPRRDIASPTRRIRLRVTFCAAALVVNGTCGAGLEAP